MTGIAPFYHERYFDSIGKPLSGGKLYFYSAGSQIPKSIFTNKELTIPATNPIILDSSGLAIQYFLDDGFYDIVITDQSNNIIDTPKNISSIKSGSNNTGSIVISGGSGWVYYNSGTSALSTSASTLPKADNSGFLHYNIGTSAYSWENVQTDSYKVKVDQFDTEDYLNEKVISGDGIDVVNLTEATRKLQINSQGKVKTSDVDSLGYLNTKFIDSETINFSENSNKMSASIVTSAVLDGKVKVSEYDNTNQYLQDKIVDSDSLVWTIVSVSGVQSLKGDVNTDNVVGDHKVICSYDDSAPDYLENKIVAGTGNVTVTKESSGLDKQLHINVFSQGDIGTGGYANTMYVANAIQTLAPNFINRSELIVLFIPLVSMQVNMSSKFGAFIAQGGSGSLRFTLRDSQYRLIANSEVSINPTPQVFLELTCNNIQNPINQQLLQNYKLDIGSRYYLGINGDINGVQLLGDDASQTNNIQPYSAYKVDNLSSIPNQLTGGSENKMRPFIRLLTPEGT